MASFVQYQSIHTPKHNNQMAKTRKITTCVNCRRTKRRCNRDRPNCSLCMHLGIKCQYLDLTPIATSGQDREHQALNDIVARLSLSSTSGPDSLLTSAHRDQLQSVFWSVYLPKDECKSVLGKLFGVAPQFSALQEAVAHADHLQSVLQACVLTTLGRRCDNSQLLQQGTLFYSRCLRQLSRDLRVGEHAKLRDILNACQLLCLYEMMRPVIPEGASTSLADAWINHARASCQVAYLLSEQAPGFDYYERTHRLSFRLDFTSRRARCCPKFIERAILSREGMTRKTLYFIITRIPNLFMRTDKLLQQLYSYPTAGSSDQFKMECIGILNEYSGIGQDLCNWESRIIDMHNTDPTNTSSKDEYDLFVISQQHGVGFLSFVCEYWASRLAVNFQAKRLTELLREKTSIELPPLPVWMEPVWPFISNITRSADTLLSTTAGLWVSEQSFFSIVTASNIAAALNAFQSPEYLTLQQAVNTNQKGQIAFTRDFLSSIVIGGPPVDANNDMCDTERRHQLLPPGDDMIEPVITLVRAFRWILIYSKTTFKDFHSDFQAAANSSSEGGDEIMH